MRIRSIKPEFWRSKDISDLSLEDRLLFIGLWSYVDDNGVGVRDEAIIAADLFAHDLSRDPRETLARVADGLQRLAAADLIVLYEVETRPYLHICTWEQHQRIDRPNKPRLPLPTSENSKMLQPSRDTRETLATGTGEQGNRGTGEQVNSSSRKSDDFKRDPNRPDIEDVLDYLDIALIANGVKPTGHTKRNWDAARLMIDRDGHTPDQIRCAIDYATRDEFWRSNILSMAKLREKYDQLRLQATRKQTPRMDRATSQFLADQARYEAMEAQPLQPQIGGKTS